MSGIGVLLGWRLRRLAQTARERDPARRTVAAAFLLLLVGVVVGEYHVFTRAFRAMAGLGVPGRR